MSKQIWVIGVGPGSKEYLTFGAIEKAREQNLLVGSQKALELFKDLNKETYVFKSDINALISFVKENYESKKIAVLVTGDPGIYSLANTMKNHFKPEELWFLPGISSVQLFFARLGRSFENVKIKSVHGRQLNDLLSNIQNYNKVCILTDAKNNPKMIARLLIEKNIKARAWIGQNLSLPDEVVIEKDLKQLSENGDYNSSLMYLEIEEI